MWLRGKIKKTHTVMEKELLSRWEEIPDVLDIHLALFG